VGVNSTLLKALMLFLSAFMTGVMGAFNAHYINFLDPDYAFSGLWTMLPIVAAIFGGYRTIPGPVIGAVVIYLADQLVFKEFMPIGHQIVLGALLAAMILFAPEGLLSAVTDRTARARPRCSTSFPARRGRSAGPCVSKAPTWRECRPMRARAARSDARSRSRNRCTR
jgi:hypothetical protein